MKTPKIRPVSANPNAAELGAAVNGIIRYLLNAWKESSVEADSFVTADDLISGGVATLENGRLQSRPVIPSATGARLVAIDEDGNFSVVDNLAEFILATASQVLVANEDGTVTLSLAPLIELTGATASRLLATDGDKITASTNLAAWIAGTANKITVTDDGDGTVTLTLPNSIQLDGATALTLLATDSNKRTVSIGALTNHGLLVGNGSTLAALGAATNGQIPIGSTGADPVLAELTAGVGITITLGAGTIEVKAKQQAAEADVAAVSSLSAGVGVDTIDRAALNTALGTLVTETNAIKTKLNNLLAKLRTAEIIAT